MCPCNAPPDANEANRTEEKSLLWKNRYDFIIGRNVTQSKEEKLFKKKTSKMMLEGVPRKQLEAWSPVRRPLAVWQLG